MKRFMKVVFNGFVLYAVPQNIILFQVLLRTWKNYWQVKQLLAVDGRLHLDFTITSTGSSQNYTRSYYMNGRDYVISGSCDEHVVRICCAQTGRRLRDVSLEVIWFNLACFSTVFNLTDSKTWWLSLTS